MTDLYNQIAELITDHSNVLDLGCGDGQLLKLLIEKKHINGLGIEMAMDNVIACVKNNISVYHGQMETIIDTLPQNSYDYIILTQTLQEVYNPIEILKKLMKIGKHIIITFPNFAYWNCRLQLLLGSAPVTRDLPFDWYNTPNIRVITFKQFRKLCKKENITILEERPIYISRWSNLLFGKHLANLCAQKGLYVLTQSTDCE